MVTCTNCGLIDDFYVIEKSNQKTAYCNGCSKYIKNIPYTEPRFFVGKYKDVPIKQINDLSYLEWAYNNMKKMSENVRSSVKDRINELKFLLK